MIEVWICCCVLADCIANMLETIAIVSIRSTPQTLGAPYPGMG
jgi:hypothetical protein